MAKAKASPHNNQSFLINFYALVKLSWDLEREWNMIDCTFAPYIIMIWFNLLALHYLTFCVPWQPFCYVGLWITQEYIHTSFISAPLEQIRDIVKSPGRWLCCPYYQHHHQHRLFLSYIERETHTHEYFIIPYRYIL